MGENGQHPSSSGVNEELRPQGGDLIDSGDCDARVGRAPARRSLINPAWRSYDSRYDLRAAYAGFLQRWEWEWFVTFTFPDAIHPEAAKKKYYVWVDRVNKIAYGARYKRRGWKGVYWVLATEWQKRGVIHFHALVSATEKIDNMVSRREAREIWKDLAGYSRVDKIRGEQGRVANYVSKYVAKEGDLDFSDSLVFHQAQLTLDVTT